MKAKKNLERGYFIDKTNGFCLIYFLIFFVHALRIIPDNITIGVALLTFLFAPIDAMTYMLLFFLPWSTKTTFSFGISLSLLQSVIYSVKAIMDNRIWLRKTDAIYGIIFAIYGGFAFFNDHYSLTGFSIVATYICATYIYRVYATDSEKVADFWRIAFFCILVSTILACLYGLIAGTNSSRWVGGSVGYAYVLYGTLGTTRFGIYLCISLIFPLYYMKASLLKYFLVIMLSVAAFSTVSLTVVIIWVLEIIYYIALSKKNIKSVALIVLVLTILISCWPRISQIDVIKPVIMRVEKTMESIDTGDFDKATSGRENLATTYLDRYKKASYFQRIAGLATLSRYANQYSHNTYIDMITYWGIIGAIVVVIMQIQHFHRYFRTNSFQQVFLAKLIMFISASTVSMFSLQYWIMWLFI